MIGDNKKINGCNPMGEPLVVKTISMTLSQSNWIAKKGYSISKYFRACIQNEMERDKLKEAKTE
jgi:hypothetical protein